MLSVTYYCIHSLSLLDHRPSSLLSWLLIKCRPNTFDSGQGPSFKVLLKPHLRPLLAFHGRSMRARKTFTGCWTCRRRRLKCDETRPACLQCLSKEVYCEGYGAKLQWLRPNAVLGSRENTQSSQRDSWGRRLLPGKAYLVYLLLMSFTC